MEFEGFGVFHGVGDWGFVGVGEGFVGQGYGGFEEAAAEETPGGGENFAGVGKLKDAFGAEVGEEILAEDVVVLLFVVANEVAEGEESEGKGVPGDSGFALFGAGSGGELGVEAVGCEFGCGDWCWRHENIPSWL